MLTQDQIIDALQFNLAFDGTGATTASPFQMTFQYANSQPGDLSSQYTGWEAWTASEKATYRAALNHIETLVNIEFVEVTGQSDPTLNVGKVDFNPGLGGLGGLSYSTRNGQLNSIDNFTLFNNTINMANATNLILHELGHALGLDHPFDGAATLPAAFDNNKYTVMSYDRNPDNNQDSDAMMLYDILALQDIWGANTSTDTGNNTYTGSRTSNMDTVWDAGGTDAFDAVARSNNVVLNLNEGAFSQFGSYEDVSIAYGVTIENARGGDGNDTITGNDGVNYLAGSRGGDQIFGGGGADFVYGNSGSDSLNGDAGDDRMFGGSAVDDLRGGTDDDFIFGGSGADIIYGNSGSDKLRGGIDNDRLYGGGGTGRDDLRGEIGNDLIYGGAGNDLIYGNSGSDTIYGGTDNDLIFGGSDSDTIYGNDGSDNIKGGTGADRFVFSEGDDRDLIRDFENNTDTLVFDQVDGVTDVTSALSFATDRADGVHFNFGDGDIVIVRNLTINDITDDLMIV
jgi:Ca2+-binding RTX toxin-like protein